LLAVAVGIALGAVHLTFHQQTAARVRKALGVALTTVGLFAVTNYVLTPKGAVQLTWLRNESDALTAATAAGQPLLIDFMADWCLPCRELDLKVFSQPDVAQALQDFTLLRVDLTREDEDPALGAVKKKYGADTLPAVRIVSPTGAPLGRTDEVLTPTRFLDLLSQARRTP
jgi:thiol:disulfide interchange protein DsbD